MAFGNHVALLHEHGPRMDRSSGAAPRQGREVHLDHAHVGLLARMGRAASWTRAR
jgi:hypothetical protein